MNQTNSLSYTNKERNGYLMGMAGQNIIYGIISSGLAFYFSSVIALPAMAISVIMAIARVWDALNDPMMGTFVDKTKTKWGKCKPYLIIMPLIIMLGTILCFVNGRYSSTNQTWKNVLIIGWAGISYIIWGMLYTAADIPLWGIASLMSGDDKKRSALLSAARMVAGIGGALGFIMVPIGQGLANLLPYESQAERLQVAFIIVAVLMSVIGTIMFQFASMAKERVVPTLNEKPNSIRDNFKLMWRNKPFRRIMISGVIRSPFQLLLILAMPLITYYFGNNGATGGITILLLNYLPIAAGVFGGQFGAMAFTPMLCRKFEKKKIFNFMNVLSGIGFALVFIVFMIFPDKLNTAFPIIILTLAFFIASAGIGFIMVLQSMMIADCVDKEEHDHGRRPDGVFFSGQSFVTKLSAGLAVIIQGIVYSIVGFEGDNMLAINEALSDGMMQFKSDAMSYSWAMFFLVSIPPAIGMILSILPMLKYEIDDNSHKSMLEELNIRRLAAAEALALSNGEEVFGNDVNNSIVIDNVLTQNISAADNLAIPQVIADATADIADSSNKKDSKPKAESRRKAKSNSDVKINESELEKENNNEEN